MDSSIFILKSGEPEQRELIFFDLDWTLVRTKSGCKFPKNSDDFEFMPNVLEKLKQIKDTHYLVIITNQAYKNKNLSIERVQKIYSAFKLENFTNFVIYAALKHDKYRKPSTGIWEEFVVPLNPKKESIFVGDALGRKKDFSDSDLMFVKNVNRAHSKALKIVKPEKFFS